MSKADHIRAEGICVATPGGGFYTVELGSGDKVLCTLGGKLRKAHIRVICTDRVEIAITPYQLDRGIIQWRHR